MRPPGFLPPLETALIGSLDLHAATLAPVHAAHSAHALMAPIPVVTSPLEERNLPPILPKMATVPPSATTDADPVDGTPITSCTGTGPEIRRPLDRGNVGDLTAGQVLTLSAAPPFRAHMDGPGPAAPRGPQANRRSGRAQPLHSTDEAARRGMTGPAGFRAA